MELKYTLHVCTDKVFLSRSFYYCRTEQLSLSQIFIVYFDIINNKFELIIFFAALGLKYNYQTG